MDNVICPICGQSNRTVKLARLYELEQRERFQNITIAKEAWQGISVIGMSNIFMLHLDRDGLADKLSLISDNSSPLQCNSKFSPPPKPEFNDAFGIVGWPLFLSGVFYTTIFIALFLDRVRFVDAYVNDWGIILISLFAMLGAIATYLGFLFIILHRKCKIHYITHVIPRWIRAREKWANIYFCERDLIVFSLTHDHFSTLSDMYDMIYSET